MKDGCRPIAVTEAVERDKLDGLFDVVRDVNLSLHPGEQSLSDLTDAEGLFRAAYGFTRLVRDARNVAELSEDLLREIDLP